MSWPGRKLPVVTDRQTRKEKKGGHRLRVEKIGREGQIAG